MYKDLLVLAEMRNVFAHHYHQQDFKSPETVSNCARLTYLDTLVRWDNDSGDPMFDHPSFKEPRQRFTMTVVMIQSRLIIKALEAQPFKQSDA